MGKKVFIIDVSACSGCYACVIACKDEHVGKNHLPYSLAQPETGQFWIKILTIEKGKAPHVKIFNVPIMCMHCENAPCMKVAKDNAVYRRSDGLVIIDPIKAKGQKQIVDACPYGVVYWNEQLQIPQKDTGDAHLVDEGKDPRCVDACPNNAIIFGDEDDPKILELKKKAEVLHPEYRTLPRVYYLGLPKPFVAGTVIDPEIDEVIPDCKVTLIDLFEDKQMSTTTDKFGDFLIKNLVSDRKYLLIIEKEGYKKLERVITADRDISLGGLYLSKENT